MAAIVALCPSEFVREDGEVIRALYERLGPESAQRVLRRSIDELVATLGGLAVQVGRHDLEDVQFQSRRLQKLALGLGMISLAAVAADLRHSHADPTAFAAVCARLLRIAEQSLGRPDARRLPI